MLVVANATFTAIIPVSISAKPSVVDEHRDFVEALVVTAKDSVFHH